MSLYDNLRDALYTSSKTYLPDNELIFSHEGGPEPRDTSYCSMNILRIDKIGMEDESTFAHEDTSTSPSTTTLKMRNVYEAVVRYMFIGKASGNLAYDFEASLDHSAARRAFGTQNLAILRKSEIRRVPEKRDTTWVDFFTLDIVFSYAVVNEQDIDIITTVNFTSDITNT